MGDIAMFNAATRQTYLTQNTVAYSPNQTYNVFLENVGYLARILVPFTFSFTTSAFSGKTISANSAGPNMCPYAAFARITLATNEGTQLYSCDGLTSYFITRFDRSNVDQRNIPTSSDATNKIKAIAQNQTSIVASTAYTISGYFVIPVAENASLQNGLVAIQSINTRLTLTVQWGSFDNGFTVSDSSSLTSNCSVAPNGVVSPIIEIFTQPQDLKARPDQAFAQLWIQEQQPVSSAQNIYNVPLANTYLRLLMSYYNNGADMVPANFTNFQLMYGGTITPYTFTPQAMAIRELIAMGGPVFPDSTFLWDFRNGNGLLEVDGLRDVFNTQQLTQMSIVSNIASSVTLTNAYVNVLKQQLSAIVS